MKNSLHDALPSKELLWHTAHPVDSQLKPQDQTSAYSGFVSNSGP